MNPDTTAFLDQVAAIVGAPNVLADPRDTLPYLTEPRGMFDARALAVARPKSTAEVAAVVALCNRTGTPIVPQGGNTGLVGGQVPDASGLQVVLSLKRMNRVREVDPTSNTMTVEAGLTLFEAQQAAEQAGRLFPLSLASEGSCTIGGNLSTNAGGTNAIVYGTARELVNGLEVVLADGRVLSDLSKLKKDNTGYDLKRLFLGAEGTLGIITAAVLKLYPLPRAHQTAFVGVADPHKALALLKLAQERVGAELKTFELMPRLGMEFVLRHGANVRDPLAGSHAWYVLMELASVQEEGLRERLEGILEAALERGLVEDVALAASLEQRAGFWRLREQVGEAQGKEGGSIKHDVSVPVASVPDFLDEVIQACEARIPGIRMMPFGHLGDGNIHCNASQPVGADRKAFLDRWDEVNELVHGIVATYGGSISAEHGIGALKRHLLPQVKDPVALDLMRALKQTLDPKGILNPGKVL